MRLQYLMLLYQVSGSATTSVLHVSVVGHSHSSYAGQAPSCITELYLLSSPCKIAELAGVTVCCHSQAPAGGFAPALEFAQQHFSDFAAGNMEQVWHVVSSSSRFGGLSLFTSLWSSSGRQVSVHVIQSPHHAVRHVPALAALSDVVQCSLTGIPNLLWCVRHELRSSPSWAVCSMPSGWTSRPTAPYYLKTSGRRPPGR